MSKFKVGDRVRVYGHHSLIDGAIGVVRNIEDFFGKLALSTLKTPKNEIYLAHPKQCRKPKPKKEPRRFFVFFGKPEKGTPYVFGVEGWSEDDVKANGPAFPYECIEVVEVKKK